VNDYYYAGGMRVELLEDHEHVCVDPGRDSSAWPDALADVVANARQQPGGIAVVPRSVLGDDALTALAAAGALRPVFRHGSALMVALPEVRVALDNAQQRASVEALLADAACPMVVTAASPDGLVLKPASGRASDALQMANRIYERAHPAASSVRFLQFVPKPDTGR